MECISKASSHNKEIEDMHFMLVVWTQSEIQVEMHKFWIILDASVIKFG